MRLPYLLKNRNFYLMLAMDAVMVITALSLAFYFRFDFDIPNKQRDLMFSLVPVFLPVKLIIFYTCACTTECGAIPG